MLNNLDDIDKHNIVFIAEHVKRLNIVTNHLNKFKKIEDYLYNELGITINISNNKKQSLLKSNLILNYDFPEELINKYSINNKCIIINIINKINIYSKKFNGVNINYYNISLPNEYIINGFSKEVVYESLVLGIKEVFKRIDYDKIKIKKLIGNNGVIRDREFNKD